VPGTRTPVSPLTVATLGRLASKWDTERQVSDPNHKPLAAAGCNRATSTQRTRTAPPHRRPVTDLSLPVTQLSLPVSSPTW